MSGIDMFMPWSFQLLVGLYVSYFVWGFGLLLFYMTWNRYASQVVFQHGTGSKCNSVGGFEFDQNTNWWVIRSSYQWST